MNGWAKFAAFAPALAIFLTGCGQGETTRSNAGSFGEGGEIQIGPSSHVSTAHSDEPHWEVIDSADPRRPKHLIGCSWIGNDLFVAQTITYSSFDGGKSWYPGLKTPVGWGDPDCYIDEDGVAFLVVTRESNRSYDQEKPSEVRLSLWRSSDGGKKWTGPVFLPAMDRPWVTTDGRLRSRFRGRLYVSYLALSPQYRALSPQSAVHGEFVYSVNHGKTFSERKTILIPGGMITDERPIVFSDGTLLIVYETWRGVQAPNFDRDKQVPLYSLYEVRSTDGGVTFGASTKIADIAASLGQNFSAPSLAVDSSDGVYRDRLYATWGDSSTGRSRIMIAYSSDKGSTWSIPRVVSDDRSRSNPENSWDDAMPAIAVNSHGVVGVSWDTRWDDPNDIGFQVRFAASLDGGQTFLSSVPIPGARNSFQGGELQYLTSTAPNFCAVSVEPQPACKLFVDAAQRNDNSAESLINFHLIIGGKFPLYGDTAGMAADAEGIFHPMWIDNRSRVPQIWTAEVTVRGSAIANWDPKLARLKNFSRDVSLEVNNGVFDTRTGMLTVQAVLANRSKWSLPLPLSVQLIRANSEIAIVSATNPNNGMSRGAAWSFTGDGIVLPPGARTKSRRLTFHLSDIRSMKYNGELFDDILKADVRVFGRPGR